MKTTTGIALSIIVVAAIAVITGCRRKSEPAAGFGERTGAAIDEAARKSADKAQDVGEKIKDATGRAVEKAGDTLEKAGEGMQ